MTAGSDAAIARVVVVSGGLGTPSSSRRLADRVTGHVERALAAHGCGAEVAVIELRDLAVAIAHRLVKGTADAALTDALERLQTADGIVLVSPVFNGSVSGLVKSFLDLVQPQALQGIPVALGATGGSARHSLVIDYAMRPLMTYLRTFPMPTGVFAATADWGDEQAGTAEVESLETRTARLGRELADAMRLGLERRFDAL
ncbi:NAD(P)H-dependent oxidoreductase [Leucobacter tardus]|uniref:NAD(P)H-dependent oxidoreductase n=1 Tax=Leucobacter tardus TaxID=501483 RepID=A0A939TNC1_9MICO|nr:CE1759 family FMN reductase [Leucobacter tardus]MBO2990373.1 NAD(P)H-dependent oxidoreductase [Leucobacter tardus]